jgi:DNA-binding CsgD family transcriptional regulator
VATVHYCYADVNGQRLFYREAGPADAPAVVLLHDFPASSSMFRDLIPLLADRYHLIAPDHPGFGLAGTPPAATFSYTLDALAGLISALLKKLGLMWTAALLLEVIADDAPADPDADAFAAELWGPLAEVKRSAPPPAEPPWRGEPLTPSETRVLHYLPTHLGTSEIAAELCLSVNTIKTHVQNLYRKLGAHSRREAVQHARAVGLFTASSAGPERKRRKSHGIRARRT